MKKIAIFCIATIILSVGCSKDTDDGGSSSKTHSSIQFTVNGQEWKSDEGIASIMEIPSSGGVAYYIQISGKDKDFNGAESLLDYKIRSSTPITEKTYTAADFSDQINFTNYEGKDYTGYILFKDETIDYSITITEIGDYFPAEIGKRIKGTFEAKVKRLNGEDVETISLTNGTFNWNF